MNDPFKNTEKKKKKLPIGICLMSKNQDKKQKKEK